VAQVIAQRHLRGERSSPKTFFAFSCNPRPAITLFCCGGKQMKLSMLLPALAGIMCVGCSTLASLDPFIAEQDAIADKTLTGVWQNAKGDDTYIIRQEDKGYSILYLSGNSTPARFHALAMRVGSAELLDLVSADENAFQLTAHYLVRVWPDGATLRWAFLDSDWMKEQAVRQLPTRKLDDRLLISASPEAAHALMLKYAADDRAVHDTETLTRVP
jgi:hypothetical protein